jgi:Tol biopolymer transport system component
VEPGVTEDVTERVSLSSAERQANGDSFGVAVTPSGRHVVFTSVASNLVRRDTDGASDVFLRDRSAGTTRRISVRPNRRPLRHDVWLAGLSPAGRFVLMTADSWRSSSTGALLFDRRTGRTSWAVEYVGSGVEAWAVDVSAGAHFVLTYFEHNLYRHNLRSGTFRGGAALPGRYLGAALSGDGRHIAYSLGQVYVSDGPDFRPRLVSVGLGGTEANGSSTAPDLSRHGRFVAFESRASNLVRGDRNRTWDVFVRDRGEHRTYVVSVGVGGGRDANGPSQRPSISPNGRFIAFSSRASNLVPGDGNGRRDVFLYDRRTEAMTLVTSGHRGGGANRGTWEPAVSASGHHVAYASGATNLVPNDTNQLVDAFVTDLH